MSGPLLTTADCRRHEALGIDPVLLVRACVQRVTDAEARELGLTGTGDLSGVVYPYLVNGHAATYRVRRDAPPVDEHGKAQRYVLAYGCNRHAYLSACDRADLTSAAVPLVLVESEKSALMLASVAQRKGRRLAPVALGGCWGWRGRIGKSDTADGTRVDVVGTLPDLVDAALPGRTVVVWLDSNVTLNGSVAAAQRALVRDLTERGASVRVARMPSLPGVNGPDDYRERSDDDAVLRVLDDAATTPASSAPRPASTSPETITELVFVKASTIAPTSVRWLWRHRIALGKMTILAGHPGLGKSTITCALAAAVTTGGVLPDGASAPPGDVVFVTDEDDFNDTLVPRLLAAGAAMDHVEVLDCARVLRPDGRATERGFVLTEDVPALNAALLLRPSVRFVVIDPVTAYLGNTDSHRTSDVRGVLRPLQRMAQDRGAAVLLVSHLNKGGSPEALSRVTGSLAFVAAARAALLVTADPEDEDAERRLLLTVKNNLAKEAPGLAYRVEQETVASGVETSKIVWTGEAVTLTADEALAAQAVSGADRSDRDEATHFLVRALSDGPRPRHELEREARAEGLAWRTVQRRAKALGVDTDCGRAFGAPAVWSYAPQAPSAPRRATPGAVAHSGAQDTTAEPEAEPQPPTARASEGEAGGDAEGDFDVVDD